MTLVYSLSSSLVNSPHEDFSSPQTLQEINPSFPVVRFSLCICALSKVLTANSCAKKPKFLTQPQRFMMLENKCGPHKELSSPLLCTRPKMSHRTRIFHSLEQSGAFCGLNLSKMQSSYLCAVLHKAHCGYC